MSQNFEELLEMLSKVGSMNRPARKEVGLPFRELNEEEIEAFKVKVERDCKKLGIPSLVPYFDPDSYRISFMVNGNYTICILKADGQVLSTGASRCNPRDRFDEKIGQALSYNRALSLTVNKTL
jgi:hypothetical protein